MEFFPVTCELFIDDAWVDVSERLSGASGAREPVSIRRGRSDEASHVQPSTATFSLKNTDGHLTPRDPRSPWYPHIKRCLRVRISVTADEVTHVRFVGEVSSIRLGWPQPRERDVELPDVARATFEVTGFLREIANRREALRSPLRRHILSDNAHGHSRSNILGYWPLEDDQPSMFVQRQVEGFEGGRQVAGRFARSGLPDGVPMHWGGDFNFGASAEFPATAAAVSIGSLQPYGWNAFLRRHTAPGNYRITLFFHVSHKPGTGGGGQQALLVVGTTGTARIVVWLALDDVFTRVHDQDTGAQIGGTVGSHNDRVWGRWVQLDLTLTQAGSNVEVRSSATNPLDGSVIKPVGGPTYSGSLGRVTGIHNFTSAAPDGPGIDFCHLIVAGDVADDWLEGARSAWHGESAARRIWRLCGEENVPVDIVGETITTNGFDLGAPLASEPVGFQSLSPLGELLRQAADADDGILSDRIDVMALRYRTRQSLLNQDPAITLDMAQRGLVEPFEPTLDDQRSFNAVTVKRTDGTEETVSIDPLCAHPLELERNLAADRQTKLQAGWHLERNQWPTLRYPGLASSLRAAGPAVRTGFADLELGDKVRLDNLMRQVGASDEVIAEGFDEVLSHWHWRVGFNASPAGPWTAGVLDEGPETSTVTFFHTNTDSDLSGASIANKSLSRSNPDSGATISTGSIGSGATSDAFAFTEAGDPGAGGSSGDYTVHVRITTSGNLSVMAAVARVNSSGTQQAESSFSSSETASTTGVKTLTLTDVDLGTWTAGDRLRVRIRFTGLFGGGSCSYGVGTADDTVLAPEAFQPNLELARIDTDGSSLDAGINDTVTTFDVSVDEGPPWDTSGDYLPADIEVGGERMSLTNVGALSAGVQSFTVTRGLDGWTKAHPAGAAVNVHNAFRPTL
jgi:hypothetical protein